MHEKLRMYYYDCSQCMKKLGMYYYDCYHDYWLIGEVFGKKYSRMDQVKVFKGCLSKILLGPFLNTLSLLERSQTSIMELLAKIFEDLQLSVSRFLDHHHQPCEY